MDKIEKVDNRISHLSNSLAFGLIHPILFWPLNINFEIPLTVV